VWVADSAFTVVGVAARGFEPPGNGGAIPISAWMPLAVNVETAREARDSQVRIAKSEMAVLARKVRLSPAEKARLDVLTAEVATPRPIVDQNRLLVRTKPGVARDQAEAELTSFAAALAARRGPSADERPPIVRLRSVGALDTSDLWLIGLVTTPAILLVVLAGANVANLLLASAAGRWREIGTRRALGASRARVTRQLLTESVLLGCLGGAAGLVLSLWLAPGLAVLVRLPADIDVSPNLAVYLCATAVTLVVAMAAAMASARHSGRDDLTSALKSDQVGAPGAWRPGRLRSLLVGGQAAASIVLLVVAALCTRSVVRAVTYDHGADIDRLVDVDLRPGRGLDPAARRMLGEKVLARIRRIPGIENVARADFTPFSQGGALSTLGAGRMHRQVFRNSTSAGYFDTIGARVLRGRTYSEEEVRTGAPVAVITESLARDFRGPDNPIGASLERLWGPDDPVGTRPDDWTRKPAGTRVIGVVEETTMGLWQLGLPIIYLPLPRDSALHFVVRVSPDREPAALVGTLHEALEALDADLSRTILLPTDLYREELEYPKMLAFLGAFVGFTALALAMVGLFGVTAFAVVQRRHEVSVRLALGANRGQVIRMLVREALKPVLIGLVCGLGLSFFFTDQVTRGYLMGISPRDPVAMIAAVTILLIAASVAAFAPARQAARVDPSVMLKQS
jgi:putative ABC transport system permease protein